MSELSPARHEPEDVNIPRLVQVAGALAVTIAGVCLVSWWVFNELSTHGQETRLSAFPLAEQERGRLPPEPRLEGIDRLEGKQVDVRPGELPAAPQRDLETYGWVDEKTGIVRIPISRAIKIIVDTNRLPARPEEARGRRPDREHPRPSPANSGRAFGRGQ
jgi:hypothetical protein